MSFRKRLPTQNAETNANANVNANTRGVRASPANGLPVTSTGCASVDSILSNHGGLPLGSGLLVEENGTTDFASVLLRYFAVEGLMQEHDVWHGGGMGESWFRELPAVTDAVEKETDSRLSERMKIAWRYASLPDVNARPGAQNRDKQQARGPEERAESYCHSFDLTRRFALDNRLHNLHASPPCSSSGDPFAPILASLVDTLAKTKGILRCIVPNLLSPTTYPPNASQQKYVVKFINNLRAILRAHPSRMSLMISLPLDLYPRTSSTTAWIQILMDGVVELLPLPVTNYKDRDGPQGLLKIHKVPMTERIVMEHDLSFKVSRKRFSVEAFSLPPHDSMEAGEGGGTLKDTKSTTVDVSF